ncbi:hypothetical protein KDA_51330 [Dictyobacter alpinus]|uniref:Uncharacterized protein n=2 Tax=Dictyobacter alpinus TaxID=2014873 RepID=A0A402BE96_9CHLR|nr:hypothetical protein KDA_51330 [Dictyobacter alpinus]
MQQPAALLPSTWESFYVIVGSASAALTGLVFVVVTLMAERARARIRSAQAIGAFTTPTVVHFCAAFLVSVILSAPWSALWNVSLLMGICGLAGAIYCLVTAWRARRQTAYHPVLEDWLWHTVFPFLAYASLLLGAGLLEGNSKIAMFVFGVAAILFLLIGIHNSWDSVIYVTSTEASSEDKNQE